MRRFYFCHWNPNDLYWCSAWRGNSPRCRLKAWKESRRWPNLHDRLGCLICWKVFSIWRAVPVLRLDRLLQLPEQPLGLYSMLILLKGVAKCPIAILVDRISEILLVSESALLPAGQENSFNACAEAVVPVRGQVVHLLSATRILLEKERDALAGFQAMAQRRIDAWEPKADWEPVAL